MTELDRRSFLKTGAAVAASAAVVGGPFQGRSPVRRGPMTSASPLAFRPDLATLTVRLSPAVRLPVPVVPRHGVRRDPVPTGQGPRPARRHGRLPATGASRDARPQPRGGRIRTGVRDDADHVRQPCAREQATTDDGDVDGWGSVTRIPLSSDGARPGLVISLAEQTFEPARDVGPFLVTRSLPSRAAGVQLEAGWGGRPMTGEPITQAGRFAHEAGATTRATTTCTSPKTTSGSRRASTGTGPGRTRRYADVWTRRASCRCWP